MRSFIPTPPEHPFPIQNLPYGIFATPENASKRVGVAIGDFVLDLAACETLGLLTVRGHAGVFREPTLNRFMSLGAAAWTEVRARLQMLLDADNPELRDNAALHQAVLHPMSSITLTLPVAIGDYTDFYSSRHHAENAGRLVRPDNPLMPNWLHLPVAYHSRSSSVVLDGTPIRRPRGQYRLPNDTAPTFGPTQMFDFELEIGFIMGTPSELGEPVPLERVHEHVFGAVILNDWSARDFQAWEMAPLGPFLSKNFASSISAWVVPMSALEPFRVPAPEQNPLPLDYLRGNMWGYDVQLEVGLQTPVMPVPDVISRTNMRHLYWTHQQQIAHHTVNGCNLRTGDLIGTGTISGPTPDALGCLLEATKRGAQPLALSSGEQRAWLEDGDTLILQAWGQGDGYRVGFGSVSGQILPPLAR